MSENLRWFPPARKWWVVVSWHGTCERCGAPVTGCGREEIFRRPEGPVRCLWCALTEAGRGGQVERAGRAGQVEPCPYGMGVDKMAEEIDLGTCCACGKAGADVRNVIMLDRVCPTPGKGWGCFVCGLPLDGAVAVVCDGCLLSGAEIQFVCRGYPSEDGRVPIGELPDEVFEHDLEIHGRAEVMESDLLDHA